MPKTRHCPDAKFKVCMTCGVKHKAAEFIGNKHTDTQLYIIITTDVLHFADYEIYASSLFT